MRVDTCVLADRRCRWYDIMHPVYGPVAVQNTRVFSLVKLRHSQL